MKKVIVSVICAAALVSLAAINVVVATNSQKSAKLNLPHLLAPGVYSTGDGETGLDYVPGPNGGYGYIFFVGGRVYIGKPYHFSITTPWYSPRLAVDGDILSTGITIFDAVHNGTPHASITELGNARFAGNVGVGTMSSSLSAPLHVNGNAYVSGNVGIGLTNPGVKLDVAGVVRAHEVKVCLNQGCDYVFDDNYKLMNLNDLSAFIKTNKHLPEVAPAAQMEAEGINVSEMNALLLKKVEELTLYVIELKNEIESLKK